MPGALAAPGGRPWACEASAGREAAWSAAEQSAAASAAATTRQRIAEGNIAYEKRFGHVFLICANGRPADDILAALTVRLRNDPDTETAGGVDDKGSTKDELYERAKDLDVSGRSEMDKQELGQAIARKQD